jgi:hypothetical protein
MSDGYAAHFPFDKNKEIEKFHPQWHKTTCGLRGRVVAFQG